MKPDENYDEPFRLSSCEPTMKYPVLETADRDSPFQAKGRTTRPPCWCFMGSKEHLLKGCPHLLRERVYYYYVNHHLKEVVRADSDAKHRLRRASNMKLDFCREEVLG